MFAEKMYYSVLIPEFGAAGFLLAKVWSNQLLNVTFSPAKNADFYVSHSLPSFLAITYHSIKRKSQDKKRNQ